LIIPVVIAIIKSIIIIIWVAAKMYGNKIMRNYPVTRAINKPRSVAIHCAIVMIMVSITVGAITSVVIIIIPVIVSINVP
jgi:hypothetical protein